MHRITMLVSLACLAGCVASSRGSSPPPRSPPSTATAHAKTMRCMEYLGGYGYCMHMCNHENAMVRGRIGHCQAEICTPGAQPEDPPVCRKAPGCEFADLDAGRAQMEYTSCLSRCTSMPQECQ